MVRRSAGISIGSRVGIDYGDESDSGDDWYAALQVGVEVGSRDGRSVGKNIKYVFDVGIDYNVLSGVNRGVGCDVF